MRNPAAIERHRRKVPPRAPLMKVLKTIGSPKRLQILANLKQKRSAYVYELAEDLDTSLDTVSHHLRLLRYCHLVEERKMGLYVQYTLLNPLPNVVRVTLSEYLSN